MFYELNLSVVPSAAPADMHLYRAVRVGAISSPSASYQHGGCLSALDTASNERGEPGCL